VQSRFLGLVVASLCACGDGGHATAPDAGVPETKADAPVSYPACHEFASLGLSTPVHHAGVLDGADLASPATCMVTDAPYGTESSGPDSVVQVSGLTVGSPYVVHVASPSDLAFYVVTGCSTPTGPSSAECVLFEDANTGTDEVGRFIAPATSVYVVVDYYASHPPSDESFVLDVYPETCATSAQCSGTTPVCSDGECVACASSFDCKTAALPRCDVSQHACAAGADQCTTDDAAEPNDDGPAGASMFAPDGDGTAQRSGQICSQPASERDYDAFEVATLGETWDLQLAWIGDRDLDLEVLDATGATIGMSYWEQPERVRLNFLAIGRYYVRISEFSSSPDPTPIAYTITTQRTLGPGCTAASDCGGEYRNQVFRGDCVAGACVDIEGHGAVAVSGACDSESDCGPGLDCSSFFFVAHPATRDVCAPGCADDDDCTTLGTNYACTTYLQHNFCVQKCTSDTECPTVLGTRPSSGPWARLSCEQATGRCLP
jgi:hypothetical protein